MKKLEILLGSNTNLLFERSILSLKDFLSDESVDNIVIVPDALSLVTEKKIFEILNIESYFNLSVMGISKFVNLILKDNGLNVLHCSNFDSKLLTLKAIQNVCDDFKCFSKNISLGFADEMYAKIEQIKSSDVKIEDLWDENASIGTKLKFHDIKLIFQEYERLRGERLDSGALLNVFNLVSQDSTYLKKCNVFFIGFDSMTKQGFLVLENVIKFAKYVQLSVTMAKEQENFRIYDGTFFQEAVDVCKRNNFDFNLNWLDLKFELESKNEVLKKLFAKQTENKNINEYFSITKTNTVSEEIDIIVKTINYLIRTKNESFKNFAICAQDGKEGIIKTKLNNLGIDVYCDNKTNLFELEPIKLIYNILKFIETSNSKFLIGIIGNDFITIPNKSKYDFINCINQYSTIYNVKNLVELTDPQIIAFANWVEELKINNTGIIEDYINFLKDIYLKLKFEEKIEDKIEELKNKNEITLEKTYRQINDKFIELLDSLNSNLKGQKLTIKEFNKIIEYALKNCEISSVPSGINQVFVGNLKSFYIDYDYVFVMGMNAGIAPVILKDYGLITDREIMSESIKAKLEPTTRIINKRNKFKLFEIILSANKKCFVSYHNFDSSNNSLQPNEFISEFLYQFANKPLKTIDYRMENDHVVNEQKIMFNSQNYYNANVLLNENFDKKYKDTIKLTLADNEKIVYKPILKNLEVDYSKLFFKNSKVSVSVVEKYNACPKSAFLANGLKLQPLKSDKVQPNILGTFIHNVGQKFVNKNKQSLGKLLDDQIINDVENIVKDILTDKTFYSLCLPENKFLLTQLIKECERFCKFLNFEQSVSSFKPIFTEKYFGKNSDFNPINIETENGKYFITGIVDRIDKFEDSFRIIDYKTGSVDNSSGANHLFYGTKIQLFVYAKAIKENLNKNLFGAFYLPIKNSFTLDGDESYSFSGFFENDAFMVLNCDCRLNDENPKSQLLNLSLKKQKTSGEVCVKEKVNILTKEELNAFCEYSQKLVIQTIKDIEQGFISPSPIKDKCTMCEFSKVCSHAKNKKIERQQIFTVKKDLFQNING